MRKMKVDQDKAQNEIEAKKREETLIDRLMIQSIKVELMFWIFIILGK